MMLPHLVYFIIMYAPLVVTVSPQAEKCDVQVCNCVVLLY